MSSMTHTPQHRRFKPRRLVRLILTAGTNERIHSYLLTKGWAVDDLRGDLRRREGSPDLRPRVTASKRSDRA